MVRKSMHSTSYLWLFRLLYITFPAFYTFWVKSTFLEPSIQEDIYGLAALNYRQNPQNESCKTVNRVLHSEYKKMLFISVLPSSVECCVQSQRVKFYSQDPKISPKIHQTPIYASAVQRDLTSCGYIHMYAAFLNRNIYVFYVYLFSSWHSSYCLLSTYLSANCFVHRQKHMPRYQSLKAPCVQFMPRIFKCHMQPFLSLHNFPPQQGQRHLV